ncbi:uncharacterized protein BO80DRAFT_416202 [Aspergillus ibericus CBS 121593]|uniref:Roadblock/LAMTOR2 domain-containing protein n=1 Tax=Aspergillus ibericus CBS 121593 TaxID=1448316 RepID=A0A395GPC6_9EURO|nr:hypothetical protein BO80DRAFT_416202 [Aspergillus ibericus CBS 121593]RAK96697.1 hypothetical protein BO80DRAFT_416202 [Aspergillus ibericus CBS 121593]
MAHPTTTTQLPQHVTSLLSHLTSRPGVQSTFILSRKDGSIIQSTGLYAAKPPRASPQPPASTDETSSFQSPSSPEPPKKQDEPYHPSQAEALAAHIFAFVSSASELSLSLSSAEDGEVPRQDGISAEGDGVPDREEGDDEVKLLRLRTKRHEIVVVPDRKYLLCVVHDAAHGVGGGSGGGGGGRGR